MVMPPDNASWITPECLPAPPALHVTQATPQALFRFTCYPTLATLTPSFLPLSIFQERALGILSFLFLSNYFPAEPARHELAFSFFFKRNSYNVNIALNLLGMN